MALEGNTFIHDPSTIIKEGDHDYIFGTGQGIRTKSSPDLIHWTALTHFPHRRPGQKRLCEIHGHFWAPDIIHVDGKFLLYYAVSTWGKQVSAIGLATSPTLDQSAANYKWTDCGMVIASTNGSDYNTIDPSVMLDDDGKLWLSFGSYWHETFI